MWMFVWSPIEFFRSRLQREPGWPWVIAAPVTCAILELAATMMFSAKTGLMLSALASAMEVSLSGLSVARLSAFSTIFGYPMFYGLATFAMICLETLGADSGNHRRIAKFTGMAFWTCVPATLFMCLAAALWVPPGLEVVRHPSVAQLQDALDGYRRDVADDPWISTGRVLYYASLLWLTAVLGAVLKVAAGYTNRSAAAASIVLFAAFGGVYLVLT